MLQISDTKHLAEPRLSPLPLSGSDVRSPTGAYVVALVAVAAAVVVRVLLQHTLGDQFLFVPMLAAIACATYYGGHGPGLAALLVGAAAITAIIPDARLAFAIGDPAYQLGLVLYGLSGYVCVIAIESLRVQRDAARRLCAERKPPAGRQEAPDRDRGEQGQTLRVALAADREEAAGAAAPIAFLCDPVEPANGRPREAEGEAAARTWHVARRTMRQSMRRTAGGLSRRGRADSRGRPLPRRRRRR